MKEIVRASIEDCSQIERFRLVTVWEMRFFPTAGRYSGRSRRWSMRRGRCVLKHLMRM
ncbi:MAG: hypothetical protein ACLR8P_19755 [Clostridium fessum]